MPLLVRLTVLTKGVKQMSEDKGSYIVDAGTGEIKNTVRSGDKLKIVRKESIEYLAQFQDWKIEHFYKGHIDEMRKLIQELSMPEKAFLFSIAVYVGYEDCCLKFPNGSDISTKELLELTDLGKTCFHETLKSLIKKDILYKGKNSKSRQYFINPWLFCKGNRINKVLKTMFKNYKIRVCGNIPWKHLP